MSVPTFLHTLDPSLSALIKPEDDLRHRPTPGGKMRDSLFWQVSMPDEGLCLQAYFFCTDTGNGGYNMCLWGTELEHPLMHFYSGTIEDENNFSEIAFGALKIKQNPIKNTAHVRYEHDGLKIDYHFEGLHSAFSYLANDEGLPEWFATNRIEQSGKLKGSIEVNGRRISLDGRTGHRDHSWGPRDWGMPHHWKWLTAYTPNGETTLNAWVWFAGGERGIAGYVARDGKVYPIQAITEKTHYDTEMIQSVLDMSIDYGAETPLALRMDTFAAMQFPKSKKNSNVITEAGCRAVIDGVEAAGQYETQWQTSYYEYLKAAKA